MENKIQYPKTPGQIEIYQWYLDIGRRFNITEPTLEKIKADLHFDEVPAYPDGTGYPLKDLQELGNITSNTNIK